MFKNKKKITKEVLNRMRGDTITVRTDSGKLVKLSVTIECPKCGTFVAPEPEEHAWGYMDYIDTDGSLIVDLHCEFCNYRWSIRRSRDA